MQDLNPLSYDSVAACKLCPNLSKLHVPSEGNQYADVMIIGQSPGYDESRARRPFVGACGEMVNYMLEEAGLIRSDVYIANVVKCHPVGNRPLLAGERNNCMNQWLKQEIIAVKPKIMVLLGKDAHTSILPSKFSFEHLAVNESKIATYLTSYHPSYFLRRGQVAMFVNGVGQCLGRLIND